ncbi:thiamine phosphate synthase [Insolitispirillum peregrinum]|uniref:Thiamine-phosphate synthase n=1 Tax=Insolitispirillum peregrinum TaxID=80876 RepID=A0A1N7IY17_9PROT|nr:thiamine phosphate synthase [Insolitispirillum peregrinum]SIS41897.1 thiamine-phosphate diphosphorylase [Insolitispirillum peregrinum]
MAKPKSRNNKKKKSSHDNVQDGPAQCRLYLITPPSIADLDDFARTLAETLEAGDVAALQIRLKDVEDDVIRAVTTRLLPIAQDRGVAVLMNDRPDLAQELGCDGVHVGQEDTPYDEARALVGPDAIVGITCHDSRHLGMVAAEQGADYVAFGAFFPTTTKEAPTQADVELLTWWQEMMTTPCVAIGGITPDNAEPLIAAGADFLAVSSGVWAHPQGPAEAVRQFSALIDKYL